jgi:copper oxidase (laccase) domain-containing protein
VTGDRPEGAVRSVAWCTQVHGTTVVVADGAARAGRPAPGVPGGRPAVAHLGEGDALVAVGGDVALAVFTADCAPVALASPEGAFGAVHAGWRGLRDGVVAAAVDALRDLGATRVVGTLGPCIHADCYEFGADDLDTLAGRFGPTVRGTTSDGAPALDLPAAVTSALRSAGAEADPGPSTCTACGPDAFSHRARGDRGRTALLVWGPGPADGR